VPIVRTSRISLALRQVDAQGGPNVSRRAHRPRFRRSLPNVHPATVCPLSGDP